MHSGGKPSPGVHHAIIEHDGWCNVFSGLPCKCVPNVSITNPDDTVVIVDEHGGVAKVAKS